MSQTMIVMGAALGAELVLLLIVALSVAYLRNRAASRRDHAAIQALVARVRQERPQREAAIGQFLGDRLGYQGADLGEGTAALARAELKLLHRFALLYRDRDADLAGRFDGELNDLLEAYHALAAASPAEPAAEAAQVAGDDAELEALRRENHRLSEELRITMETMSRMLNEYSTMFAPIAEPEGLEPMLAAVDDPSEPMESPAEVGPGSDDGDWEVAVAAAGESDRADEDDWEVAVDADDVSGAATFADGLEVDEREPEDPLAQIMRAAQNQEQSARGVVEAMDSSSALADAADEVDLFDVVVEGSPTKVPVERDSTAGAGDESGEDLFDVVEAPRSRSAS